MSRTCNSGEESSIYPQNRILRSFEDTSVFNWTIEYCESVRIQCMEFRGKIRYKIKDSLCEVYLVWDVCTLRGVGWNSVTLQVFTLRTRTRMALLCTVCLFGNLENFTTITHIPGLLTTCIVKGTECCTTWYYVYRSHRIILYEYINYIYDNRSGVVVCRVGT